jgi:hypothetical protein
MERIKQIWAQLESSKSLTPGLFKIRYSDESKCDVFLGIKFPENYRILIIRTPFSIGKEFGFKYEFKGLKFDKIYDPDNPEYILLNLVLTNNQFKDIFDSLVADIVNNIINEEEIKVILKNYTNRLTKWQSLFEQFNQQGLTSEEQRGLYGELFFLRKFLQNNSNPSKIITSWVGCEKQIRDFQYGGWGVEVKTTQGNNHQKINVSSERQLDTSNIANLFLFHLSMEERLQAGETLNQLVDSVKEILSSDLISLNRLTSKLFEAGYFDQHSHFYDNAGYFIRQETFYKVEESFPRIEEKDIRNGVGDVKYSIILSQCSAFVKSDQEVFKTLTTDE